MKGFFKPRPRLSLKEQSLFANRLSILVKAGVPLLKAVGILEDHASSGTTKAMYQYIFDDISNGQSLSKSLGKWKKVFGDFTINIIRIGETTGTLSSNLKYLGEEIDKKRKLRQKITGALTYPIVIALAALIVSGMMVTFLFPKLLPVFKSLNVPLPLMTRILLFISNFLISYWLWLILGIIVLAIAFVLLLRLKKFHFAVDAIALRLPIVGELLMRYHIVSMCRTMGILFKTQVNVLEGIDITADTATNMVYQKELHNLNKAISMGSNIATYMQKRPKIFPKMVTQMIAIGEETGNLSDTLIYLSEIYEGELDEQTKRLSSVIEPTMMVVMGLLVGFIAVSIITPIYEVTQHLSPR